MRREAIAALGKLRTPRALPFLRQALQDPDVTVATAASEAIASFRGYQPKLTQKNGPQATPQEEKFETHRPKTHALANISSASPTRAFPQSAPLFNDLAFIE
ncbi:MAG: HEAT repeat domain-containing protein [Synechococcales cyanobacterium RU_4_20]|nr:HEAT repeat domain-containing protein [Synechococcales cyanobacterium RU_4_20]